MADLLPEQAREMILASIEALAGTEVLPLQSCLGRVLAGDLVARVSHPPRRVSAMDGYAVRTAQANKDAVLRLVGRSAAGTALVPKLAEDATAVQIFTGAALPDGADAVLIDEHSVVERGDAGGEKNYVRVLEQPMRDRYIRAEGGDFAEGSVCLKASRLLSVRDIALAATMNYAWLSVRRRPRLAIVASGFELAHPGEAHGSHQIAAANSLMLAMLAESFGAEVRIVPFAEDSLASLSAALRDALGGADIVVASGGASRSATDWTGAAMAELGIEERFSRLAMRPGKPTRFGILKDTRCDIPVLVLPGNPASVYVGALVFLRVMIERMLSQDVSDVLEEAEVGVGCIIAAGGERSHYMRGFLEGGVVRIFSDQESSHTLLLARANCLVVQPAHAAAKGEGDRIGILPIPPHCCGL